MRIGAAVLLVISAICVYQGRYDTTTLAGWVGLCLFGGYVLVAAWRFARRYMRALQLLKWIATAACGLIIALTVLSCFFIVSNIPAGVERHVAIFCGRGNLDLAWSPYASDGPFSSYLTPIPSDAPCFYFGGPRYTSAPSGLHMARVPLWCLLLLMLIPATILWYVDRPSTEVLCVKCDGCGYNLTGNVSGRCPECGTAFSREA